MTQHLTIWVYTSGLLLDPQGATFTAAQAGSVDLTTGVPARLIHSTGLLSWVTVRAGSTPDLLVVSGTPLAGTSGTFHATVAVTVLAPPDTPPPFAASVN